MKEYLELREIQDDGAVNPAEIIRVYVTDKKDSQTRLKLLKKDFTAKKYKAIHVKCKHEEGLPCESETLEEVKE